MAPKRKPSSPISIGNCDITVEANNFTCKSDSNGTVISLPRSGKIKVSVVQDVSAQHRNASEDFRSEDREHEFVLVNPKDVDGTSKSYLQEIPYTTSEIQFCRKFGKVIAAITYQIIPADTEYAEIPLAAVSAFYQRKAFLEVHIRLLHITDHTCHLIKRNSSIISSMLEF